MSRSRRRSTRRISWPNGNGTASACKRSPRSLTMAAMIARLYSRTGEDISKSFPDLLDALRLPGAIDGELLIMRDGRVQSFNVLQQRLNRKTVTPKLIAEFPAHLRAYDLLADGDGRFARAAVRRAPRAAGRFCRAARRAARRSLAARSHSRPGTNSPPRATIRPRPAPAPMPTPSKASCSSAATRSMCPAGRKARGGNGSAIRSSSMPC